MRCGDGRRASSDLHCRAATHLPANRRSSAVVQPYPDLTRKTLTVHHHHHELQSQGSPLWYTNTLIVDIASLMDIDNEQPAFLRRLRGELTSGDSARHEQPIPRNKRLKKDEEDDAPTYILEDTKESLTKEEYEALVSGKDSKDEADEQTGGSAQQASETTAQKPKEKIAEVGASTKKRKAAKIVNEAHEDGHADASKDAEGNPKATKKAKKKSKAVKLTFGENE